VAQIDSMSGGRVEFGLGAGWRAAEQTAGIPFPETAHRMDRLEEQLAIITGLWATPTETARQFARAVAACAGIGRDPVTLRLSTVQTIDVDPSGNGRPPSCATSPGNLAGCQTTMPRPVPWRPYPQRATGARSRCRRT
jgi:alkanesulfonate monooxygenase SsuD/methylene tetrahydromethanopterin reductase-like flavin-dependent oxidoreductase (luciferase family)